MKPEEFEQKLKEIEDKLEFQGEEIRSLQRRINNELAQQRRINKMKVLL